MAVRNLHRQAQPFRWLGWGLYLGGLWWLPETLVHSASRTAGMVFGLIALLGLPLWALWGWYRASPSGAVEPIALADYRVVLALRLELLLAPAFLTLLQLPLVIVLTVTLALSIANLALLGRRTLRWALTGGVLGGLSGLASEVGPVLWSGIGFDAQWHWLWCDALGELRKTSDSIWLTALCMLAAFSAGLSCVAFQIAQKLDAHRLLWRERAALLEPFVPPGLLLEQPPQKRRWLCVVMVDVLDFTHHSAALAPETIATVLDDLLDATVRQAAGTGGTLDKFMGDGALLFFTGGADTLAAGSVAGAQAAHAGALNGDHQDRSTRRRAVQAALRFVDQLSRELPALNGGWQACGVAQNLQLRFGVASGYCSLGERGRASVRAFTLVGRCVGLAQRLQHLARPNSLTLCPVSARLIASPVDEQCLLEWPERLMGVGWDGSPIPLQGRDETPRGFPLMRVYRPSDKVHAPSL